VSRPRIYVASLSDYNAGRLHGVWIDAAQPIEDVQREVDRMLATSPEPVAEEWAIHDYDNFGPLGLGEYENLAEIATIARGIAEHGTAFACWAAILDRSDWSEQLGRFADAFVGRFDDYAAFAMDYVESTGISLALIDFGLLSGYVHVDYQRLGRDLVSDYRTLPTGEGLFVFEG
jgi:antirestriction protein